MKDKNTIIGILLITVILIGYYIINLPTAQQTQQNPDSALPDTVRQNAIQTEQAVPVSVTATDRAFDSQQSIVASLDTSFKEEKIYYLENNFMKIGISNIGAKIVYLELKSFLRWDKKPLILVNRSFHRFGLTFFLNNKPLNTDYVVFEPVIEMPDSVIVVPENTDESFYVVMRYYPLQHEGQKDTSIYIEYRYGLSHDSYLVDFHIKLQKISELVPPNVSFINLDLIADLYQQEKSFDNELHQTTIYYAFTDGEVSYISERKTQHKESIPLKLKWVSFKQQFFSMAFIASDAFDGAELEVSTALDRDSLNYLKTLHASLAIPFGKSDALEIPLMLYCGPNKYSVLRQLQLGLERQIPLGWSFFLLHWINRYVVLPIFNFLEKFHLNYGIIILIMTIIIKIILLPIAFKTYLSTARMKILKPEIEEINKKFSRKEDTVKKQQAIMELYRKAGVNPLSGCLPMLLQLPILIAMFRFFPASIELRQQAFLWADDLSSYDSILDLGFHIPFYGSHVSLFTLLMTISTLIYTHINSKMMSTGSQQLPGMKTMMYLMPVLFLGFFNSYSCALSYYYLLTNLFTFAQMGIFQKIVNEEKLRQQIEENKKKPRKLSWQERLEKMAREQQARQNQKKGKK